jgi:hypothetical protein
MILFWELGRNPSPMPVNAIALSFYLSTILINTSFVIKCIPLLL